MKGQVVYPPINGYHTATYKRHPFCPFFSVHSVKSILVRVAGHLIQFFFLKKSQIPLKKVESSFEKIKPEANTK